MTEVRIIPGDYPPARTLDLAGAEWNLPAGDSLADLALRTICQSYEDFFGNNIIS